MRKEIRKNHEEVQALLRRLKAVRWCEPDASMENLDREALLWIEERCDELRSALNETTGALLKEKPQTFRSLSAFTRTWKANVSLKYQPLSDAFKACKQVLERALPQFSSPIAVNQAIEDSRAAPSVWHRSIAMRGPQTPQRGEEGWNRTYAALQQPPAVLCCHAMVRWVEAFGSEKNSPWNILLAFFERGLWPAVSGPNLLLYVPLRLEDSLVDDDEITPLLDAHPLWLLPNAEQAVAAVQQIQAGLPIPPMRFVVRTPEGERRFMPCLRVAPRPPKKPDDE